MPRKAAAKSKTTVIKASKKTEPEPVEVQAEAEAVVEVDAAADPQLEDKSAKQHKSFEELFTELSAAISDIYKQLQAVNRQFKQLSSAHKRSVVVQKPRTSANKRTPSVVFSKPLVDYLRSKLSDEELTVNRKINGESQVIDLSDLNTETRVFRTDVTQLFNHVFKKHNMLDPKDKRCIAYKKDKQLVKLLTTGDIPEKYKEAAANIKKGTHELRIFNIQCVISQHLTKIDLKKAAKASAASASA